MDPPGSYRAKYIHVTVSGHSPQNINMKNADTGVGAMWMCKQNFDILRLFAFIMQVWANSA
jgi:hypothetical protein